MSVLCLLLVCVMSTAQVCHTHDLIPQTKDSQQNQQGPDHCPLCIAMHSAMPATLQTVPEPVLHVQTLDSVAAESRRIFQWRFAQASRPPPADSDRA
jgi:hypothetical protein